MENKKDRTVLAVVFAAFLLINGLLVIVHEPWRDEIHAWLMSRYMTIPEMISFSRYEGHPVMWHILLVPLAKLGAPVWTMHLLSYLVVSASAFIFLFKVKLNTIVKAVTVFTLPFIYVYSSVARNYCLILLLVVIIAAMYERRYEHPFLYSIPVALLVFTHAMAWGLVAGLTITFHIYELLRMMCGKESPLSGAKIRTIAGLALIAVSSIAAVITLYGQRNIGYAVGENDKTDLIILSMILIIALTAVYTAVRKGKIWRESVMLAASYLFMICVYKTVYSGVLLQRLVLIQVFFLLFMICVREKDNIKANAAVAAVYFISFLISGALFDTIEEIRWDITANYSSAVEMADYINRNLPDEEVILVDAGVFEQTMVPYTDKELYDIRYKAKIEDALYCVNEPELIMNAVFDIPNHEEYRGKYLILYYAMEGAPFDVVYKTSDSFTGENYTLYYIP